MAIDPISRTRIFNQISTYDDFGTPTLAEVLRQSKSGG